MNENIFDIHLREYPDMCCELCGVSPAVSIYKFNGEGGEKALLCLLCARLDLVSRHPNSNIVRVTGDSFGDLIKRLDK